MKTEQEVLAELASLKVSLSAAKNYKILKEISIKELHSRIQVLNWVLDQTKEKPCVLSN